MPIDLSNPLEKPSLDTEALLRALGVSTPGAGLQYNPAAGVVILGFDATRASRMVALPERGFELDTTPVPAAGDVAGLQVNAGPSGCWLYPFANTAGPNDLALLAFDSEAAAVAAGLPTLTPAAWPIAYTRNGAIGSVVQSVSFLQANGVNVLESVAAVGGNYAVAFLNMDPGYWVPPGGIARLFNPVAATAASVGAAIREPLA